MKEHMGTRATASRSSVWPKLKNYLLKSKSILLHYSYLIFLYKASPMLTKLQMQRPESPKDH